MKVVCVVGTRPEAIKMAPVVLALQRRPEAACRVVVTAQHRQMTDDVMRLFGIAADHDLDVMASDQTPSAVAAAVLSRLEPVLARERPDWVLVQGDTTTVVAAAMTAFYGGWKVAHVEAGLRTRDRRQPFPEEVNRQMTAFLADRHFAPTATARANLLTDGVPAADILVTGNTVIDALRQVAQSPEDVTALTGDLEGRRLLLVTAHRRENFGAGLEGICDALLELCRRYGDAVRVLYAVHPNPNVDGPVRRRLGAEPRVHLTPPVSYRTLVSLLARSFLVLTDSGGIQEEAPTLGKPVLVLRAVTERPEAVEAGTVRLVGTDPGAIVAAVAALWERPDQYERMARAVNPYGDGRAAERIVRSLRGEAVEPFSPRPSPAAPA